MLANIVTITELRHMAWMFGSCANISKNTLHLVPKNNEKELGYRQGLYEANKDAASDILQLIALKEEFGEN